MSDDLLAKAGIRIGEQAKEIAALNDQLQRAHQTIQALNAQLLLAGSLAAQRSALIEELISRLPEDQREIV